MPDSELGMASTMVDKTDGVLVLLQHNVQEGDKEKKKSVVGEGEGAY